MPAMAASHSSWYRWLVLNDTVDEVDDDEDIESERTLGGPIGGRTLEGLGIAPRPPEVEAGAAGGSSATGAGATMEEEDGDESKLSSTPTEMTRVSGSSATTTVVDGATTTVGIDAETATAAMEAEEAAADTASETTVDEDAAEAASESLRLSSLAH